MCVITHVHHVRFRRDRTIMRVVMKIRVKMGMRIDRGIRGTFIQLLSPNH